MKSMNKIKSLFTALPKPGRLIRMFSVAALMVAAGCHYAPVDRSVVELSRVGVCSWSWRLPLEGVAAEIDAKIKEIMESNGRISITQAATLTALEYADRYKKAEQTSENLRSQIHSYLEDAARSRTDAEIARRENERLQNEIKLLKSKK